MQNPQGFGLILSSIYWREAWKYGERALRYCHLDVGHALGALRFSANLSGWGLRLHPEVGDEQLDQLLGFDRIEWPDTEGEQADCLCWVSDSKTGARVVSEWLHSLKIPHYPDAPNQLSAEHHPWPIIQDTARATCSPGICRYPCLREPGGSQCRPCFRVERRANHPQSAQCTGLRSSYKPYWPAGTLGRY